MKNLKLKLIIAGVFTIGIITILNAANYVTVATVGNRLPAMDKSKGMQNVVEQVKNFWKKELAQVIPARPDLIVLPEVCDKPGGLNTTELTEYYEVRKNQVLDFFKEKAAENRCYIAYGTKRVDEKGSWRNSIIVIDREGDVAGIYDKNFPTIGEIESGIVPGDSSPLIKCDFGTVGCAICFDLNFTELCDEYAVKKPDILIFSSMYHGGLMQEYWAYRCRSFFVGSLAPRTTPSEIRDPFGQVLASSTNYFDYAVTTINIDAKLVHLDYNWERLRKMKEKYGPMVTVFDPGKVGAVLITSEHPDISIDEMIDEFDIELLDNYLTRARKAVSAFSARRAP
ncbi:MAG: carbon-nitrogen hydrolase family protein [Prolixibacteraceae bacterium]|nr:carbon-nitrogen hydrolase family protein [Prolixibacteraceae bacterium]